MKKQRLLTFIGTVLLPGFLAGTLCHADDTTSPLHLEYAIVVPHGNTINFYGVPVVGSTGSQDYDMEITLSVGADGTLHADSTKITPSPVLANDTHHFTPGDFVNVHNSGYHCIVTGPVLAPDGRQIWSYTAGMGHGNWLTGPPQGNTLLASLPQDAIYPKGYCFGLDNTGNLIAVQQLGDKLLLAHPNQTNASPQQYTIGGSDMYQLKPVISQ